MTQATTKFHGFRRIPPAIRAQIDHLDGGSFYVGRRWRLNSSELPDALLSDLGAKAANGEIVLPDSDIPTGTTRWINWNRFGRTVVRRDLPKVPRSWTMTTPNFGDGARFGYSTHTRTVLAYPRTEMHGKGFAFEWDSQTVGNETVLSVRVGTVFGANQEPDSPDLLMALSLIGESFGAPAIFGAAQSPAEWLATQSVSWEFLPLGHGDSLPSFDEIAERVRLSSTSRVRDTYRERYLAVTSLMPQHILTGTTGLLRYVAFDFGDVKVLENFTYGNAIYVMRDDWETLSKLSRPELRNLANADFERIVHRSGWQLRLAKALGREPA